MLIIILILIIFASQVTELLYDRESTCTSEEGIIPLFLNCNVHVQYCIKTLIRMINYQNIYVLIHEMSVYNINALFQLIANIFFAILLPVYHISFY